MKLEDVAFKLAMRARAEDGLALSAARVLQAEILTALREERERCAKIAEKHEKECGRDPQEPCAGAISVQIREGF